MTESQPPLTRRELREMRARREAELQNRAASTADEAPGRGPGASPRVPSDGGADAAHAARRRRRATETPSGTLFLPRAAAERKPAPAAQRPDSERQPAPAPVPVAERQPAPAQRPVAERQPAPAAPEREVEPRSAPAAAPRDAATRSSRRKERLRRQAEQARQRALDAAEEADRSDDTLIPAPPSASRGQASPEPATGRPAGHSEPASPTAQRPAAPAAKASQAASPAARVPAPGRSSSPAAPLQLGDPQPPSSTQDHATHRRRREGSTHHSAEVQAALGASPTLEAAQAEIEAMAAAREAALRRALARRGAPAPSEPFSAALGLSPAGAVPHVPRLDAPRDAASSRPPRTPRRPGEREAQFPAPGTPTGPVPWQRPEAPAAPTQPAAAEPGADGDAATSFSELLGIPAAPPVSSRPRRGGRRAQPSVVEDRAAQKRLENTGLIAPVTQEISVVVPNPRAASARAQAESADATGPVAASSAHGLDPLEYRSAGVHRSRWGLIVVLASVLVAATAVVWAVTA